MNNPSLLDLRRRFASDHPWLRRAVVWFSMLHLVLLVLGVAIVRDLGERYWLTGVLLYLPPLYALAPLLVLTPAAVLLVPRACWLHFAAGLFLATFYVKFYWSLPARASGVSYTLVSNNVGQRRLAALHVFDRQVRPDIVMLQEAAAGDGWWVAKELGGFGVTRIGQFILVSRFPVIRSGPVPGLDRIAARFELNCDGRRLVVYDVHFPTPRPDFARLRGQGFRAGLRLGGGIYSATVRRNLTESMRQRIGFARTLVERVKAESEPVVVAGDFNAPAPGRVHAVLAEGLTDAFAVRGRGFGLTFPGISRNPFSFFGPWLRIDYAFAGPQVVPLDCWVEPPLPAQHLAVVMRFRLGADR